MAVKSVLFAEYLGTMTKDRYSVRYQYDDGADRSFIGTLVQREPGILVFAVDGRPGRYIQSHWIIEMVPL